MMGRLPQPLHLVLLPKQEVAFGLIASYRSFKAIQVSGRLWLRDLAPMLHFYSYEWFLR